MNQEEARTGIKGGQLSVLMLMMFIFTLGFGITVPVMPYFVKSLGGSVVDVGLLMAAFSAGELLCAPIWGIVSDRIGRKPVMLAGLAGFGIAFGASGLATQLWMLYTAQLVAGIMMAGIFPAVMAYIADLSEPGERGKLMGMLGAANGMGIIFGPVLASVFTIWGLTVPFFVATALAMVTAAVTLVWIRESRHHEAGSKSKAAGKTSWLQPQLLIFFLMMLFVMVAMSSLESTFGFYAMGRFGLSETASPVQVLWTTVTLTGTNFLGIGFMAFGLVGALAQVALVGKVIGRLGEERTIVVGLVALALGTIMLIFAWELVSVLISACLMAVGMGLMMPSINSAVSRRTDKDNQGAVMGVLGTFNSAGRVIGPIAGGIAFSIALILPYALSALIALISAAGLQAWTMKSGARGTKSPGKAIPVTPEKQ